MEVIPIAFERQYLKIQPGPMLTLKQAGFRLFLYIYRTRLAKLGLTA